MMNLASASRRIALFLLLLASCTASALAQTTAFTYQGHLSDGSNPATGTYDMQFALFDSSSGPAQIGATLTNPSVVVTNGNFTVTLDFGGAAFPGAARYLEVSVRPAGSSGAYTVLMPRQPLTPVPYALRTVSAATSDTATNAVQLGGIAASQYVQTTDPRLSGGGSGVPVGTVIAYAGPIATVPSGWLVCDGAEISRTQESALFAAIGTSWGAGDGATTFNLPDLGGRFLRGVDKNANGIPTATPRDPDRDARTASNAGGNAGNNVGSAQADQFGVHTHGISDPGHSHAGPPGKKLLAVPRVVGDANITLGHGTVNQIALVDTAGSATNISLQDSGGSENRPKNAYVIWIIKAH